MKYSIFIVFALLLSACATPQPKVEYKTVYKDRYVPMPAIYTQPCLIPELPSHSAKAITRTNNARLAALLKCDAEKSRIREKEGQYVEH